MLQDQYYTSSIWSSVKKIIDDTNEFFSSWNRFLMSVVKGNMSSNSSDYYQIPPCVKKFVTSDIDLIEWFTKLISLSLEPDMFFNTFWQQP